MVSAETAGERQVGLGVEMALRLLLVAYLMHFAEEWRNPAMALPLLALNVAQLLSGRIVLIHALGALLFLGYFLASYPGVANHVTVGAVVAGLVLFLTVFKGRAWQAAPRDPPASLGADLALLAAVVYLGAGFHKLNSDFFDSSFSCANWYSAKVLAIWGSAEPPLEGSPLWEALAPYLAVAVELGGGLGLLWRRTRALAIVALFALHLWLGVGGFADFSSLMVALLVAAGIAGTGPSEQAFARGEPLLRAAVLVYVAAEVLSAVIMYGANRPLNLGYGSRTVLSGFFFVLPAGALAGALLYLRRSGALGDPAKLRPSRAGFGAAALLLVWAAFPYLGLGNAGSLTMFSNLNTMADRGNHLVIPAERTKLFGFEEDYVFVKEMDPRLRDRFRGDAVNQGVARSDLARRVKRFGKLDRSGLKATLLYQGREERHDDLGNSPLARYHWYDGLLVFRTLQLVGRMECRW